MIHEDTATVLTCYIVKDRAVRYGQINAFLIAETPDSPTVPVGCIATDRALGHNEINAYVIAAPIMYL